MMVFDGVALAAWIARQSAYLDDEIAQLEAHSPDWFTPQPQIIEHLEQVSTLAGRRSLLNELIEFTGLHPAD